MTGLRAQRKRSAASSARIFNSVFIRENPCALEPDDLSPECQWTDIRCRNSMFIRAHPWLKTLRLCASRSRVSGVALTFYHGGEVKSRSEERRAGKECRSRS